MPKKRKKGKSPKGKGPRSPVKLAGPTEPTAEEGEELDRTASELLMMKLEPVEQAAPPEHARPPIFTQARV